MADWKSRLVVMYDTVPGEGGEQKRITPIDAFTPTFSLNADACHSIEATHIGVIYTPQNITFSMTVKAIGEVVGELTKLAMEGKRFDVALFETDEGNDWSFQKIVLSDCLITSASPTPATISGVPAATFSGFSLQASVETKSGEPKTATIGRR